MKYGIAIVWDGSYPDKLRADAQSLCLRDCILIKLQEINDSMQLNGLPRLDFMTVTKDETDLKA